METSLKLKIKFILAMLISTVTVVVFSFLLAFAAQIATIKSEVSINYYTSATLKTGIFDVAKTYPDGINNVAEIIFDYVDSKIGAEILTVANDCDVVPVDTRDLGYENGGISMFLYPAKAHNSITRIVVLSSLQINANPNCNSMFSEFGNLTSIDFNNFNTKNVTDMSSMFFGCYDLSSITFGKNFNTENVTNMSYMFYECSKLESLDVSNFNTGNVTDMSFMFSDCYGLTSLDVSNFNTENVRDMNCMFNACRGLTSLDVSNFNTGNVTDMSYMFYGCESLTSLDVSNFNTINVTNMNMMFRACNVLTSLDVSNFNTGNVTDMSYMFYGCESLTSLDVTNFNTENVSDMSHMFAYSSKLTSLDLSSFNTKNVTDMSGMFSSCQLLKTIYVGENWSTQVMTDAFSMFYGCASLVGGAGTAYDGSKPDKTYAKIDGGTADPGYLTQK